MSQTEQDASVDTDTAEEDAEGAQEAAAGSGQAAKIYTVVLSVGVCCSLAIVTVYRVTLPIIQANMIAMREEAILEVLPAARTSSAFRLDESGGKFAEVSSDTEGSDLVFAGYDDSGKLVGLAIETKGMGYQDFIRVLYGYSPEAQAIIGTRVLESRETPGLGTRIETDETFVKNFEQLDVSLSSDGTDLANPIEFVKPGEKEHAWQIDGITGATISSRAMAKMLSESSAYWMPRVYSRRTDFEQAEGEK
jgi:electron transport complex protein RnfG